MVKVSVVIAMYNEEEYIGRCIESFINQSYSDFELILIDDGSTHKTIEKAESYTGKLPLKILKQQYDETGKKRNNGQASARNQGVQNTVGYTIMILYADMCFDKEYKKELVTPIIAGEEIGTAHGIEKIVNPENKQLKVGCIDRISNPQTRGGIYRALLKNKFLKNGNNDFLKIDGEGSKYDIIGSLTSDDIEKYKKIMIE